VRFSKSKVIRNLFLLNILRGFLKGRERSQFSGTCVLSKTAGAGISDVGCPGLIAKPAQTGKTDFRAQACAQERFEPLDLERRRRVRGQGIRASSPVPARCVIKDGRSQPAGHVPRDVAANRRELAVERAEKAELVTQLKGVFQTANTVVVAHYAGLTVAQMQTLRRQAKQGGASVKVAKNRLAKIALEGTDAAPIGPLLKGPTVIAYSSDPVAASKVSVDFAKGHEKFVILGGVMGKTTLDPNGVKALASLPSLDELRAKIVGLIQAPATKIAQVISAPAAKVARVVQAYANKSPA
jgi:large subunit ribosomal protein L10